MWFHLDFNSVAFHTCCQTRKISHLISLYSKHPRGLLMTNIGHFYCVTSVFSLCSLLSVFDIVYLFIILRPRWTATGGSAIKGEMEVEYVSAVALKSIRLWTDGLINRWWLEQIGSAGCLAGRRWGRQHTCSSCKCQPLFSSISTSEHSCVNLSSKPKRRWPVWFEGRWSKVQMMTSAGQSKRDALTTSGVP